MEQEKTAIEQQVKLQMQDAAYGTPAERAAGYFLNQYSKNVSSRRFTIVHAA